MSRESSGWFCAPTLSDAGLPGPHPRLRLEPLARDHAEGFLAAADHHADEVFEHLARPRHLDQQSHRRESDMSAEELVLDRDETGNRYTATLDGSLVGLIDYSERPGAVLFLHTETDPAHQGRGFAARLTTYALDDVRERGLSVVPLCSYTQRFLTENPAYADLLAEPGTA